MEKSQSKADPVTIVKVDRDTDLHKKLLEFVRNFSWDEVKAHTVKVLEDWSFEDWETPFAAMANGRIVGMATIARTDYYPLPDICPWISTIFVDEEYRGHRISGKLIDFANDYAKGIGFSRTYIPSEHIGLYEKYGYRFVREIVNYGGGTDRLYERDVDRVEIRETTKADLGNVQRLWADGDVMKFVGFPEGLHNTDEEMEDWYGWIDSGRPLINHFSVFENGVYSGESFYEISREHGNYAAVDIKLFGFARGRGIAAKALSFAVNEAFRNGAEKVWVDPNPENAKAIALYKRLGFEKKERPSFTVSGDGAPSSVYMELGKEKHRQ